MIALFLVNLHIRTMGSSQDFKVLPKVCRGSQGFCNNSAEPFTWTLSTINKKRTYVIDGKSYAEKMDQVYAILAEYFGLSSESDGVEACQMAIKRAK